MVSHSIIYLTPFPKIDSGRREYFVKSAFEKHMGIDVGIYTLREFLNNHPPLNYLGRFTYKIHLYPLSRLCTEISSIFSLKKINGFKAAICLNTLTTQVVRKAFREYIFVVLDYMDVFLKNNGELTSYETKTITKADIIIFWSKALKELLNKFYGKLIRRSEYVPFGIDLSNFDKHFTKANPSEFRKCYGIRDYEFIVTFSGIAWKGLRKEAHGIFELIPALKKLLQNIPHIKIVFQGIDISKFMEFYKKIKKHSLLERTLILPVMRRYDNLRMSLLKASNILLLPSSNWPTIAYAEQMKTFEYMAAAKPIVAHDVPGLRGVLNDSTAFFCKLEDTENFVSNIINIYENPDEAYEKAEKARIQVVQNYDWKILAPKYVKIIANSIFH